MKGITLLLFVFTFIIAHQSIAQIDTTRKHEFRLSYFGSVPILASQFDDRLMTSQKLNNSSITYLRRYKKSKYFFVGALSGRGSAESYFTNGNKIGEGRFNNLSLFLGAEKQSQFKHIGFFISAGMKGGFANYYGDFQFQDSPSISDFKFNELTIGLSGRVTAVTNITDNLYLFLTSSANVSYESDRYTNRINEECCNDSNGFDTNFFFIDAIGIAYKLPLRK